LHFSEAGEKKERWKKVDGKLNCNCNLIGAVKGKNSGIEEEDGKRRL
jgi:hypothetical protein